MYPSWKKLIRIKVITISSRFTHFLTNKKCWEQKVFFTVFDLDPWIRIFLQIQIRIQEVKPMPIQQIWILGPDYKLWNTLDHLDTILVYFYNPILHTFTFISLVRQTVENRTTVVTKCSPWVIGVHLPLMQVRTLGNKSLE